MQIFIDGHHVFKGVKSLGKHINYEKLVEALAPDSDYHKLRFYSEVDESSDSQHRFLTWMQHHGFIVSTLPVFPAKTSDDKTRHANIMPMIVTDMMLAAHNGEKEFILISGSTALTYTIGKLSDMGCRVELASFKNVAHADLMAVCDEIIDLATLDEIFEDRDSTE